jgi:hypothetical protein
VVALGTALLVVIVAALTIASGRAVSRLLPSWVGPDRWLAQAVVALAVLFAVLHVAGSVSGFSTGPIVVLLLLACAAVIGVSGRRRRVERPPGGAREPIGRRDGLALAVLSVVGVQWLSHTVDAVHRGMSHPDTFWYHIPFAARFVQVGSFTRIDGLGYEAARWFPFDSQLVHGVGIALLGNDAVSPFLNLAWAGLAVLAAWSIGERVGDRATAVLGAAAALGIPVLAATQPGQASSDIACAALLLAAVALLLASELEPVPMAIAGVAAGLAIATKVTIAVPFAVLVLGVVVVCLIRRRWLPGVTWLGGVAVTGSYWFIRNWVGAGTPLPWLDVTVGPIQLPAVVDEGGTPLIDVLFDREAWSSIHVPGLEQGLGRAWPVVLGLVLLSAVALVAGRRRAAVERVIGLALVAGVVGYVFTPLTGGLSFVFNLRYLSPVLVVGFVLLAGGRWRTVSTVGLVVVAVSNALATHHEETEAWPQPAVLVALGVVGAVAVGWFVLVRRTPAGHARVGLGVAAAIVLVVAWFATVAHYEDHRFVAAGRATDRLNAWFRDVRDADVAVLGTDETMPMFGPDLSNRVRRADDPPPAELTCAGWRRALTDYDYVVVTELGFSLYYKPAPEVLATDPGARVVVDDDAGTVYAIDELDPEACPPE